MEISQLNDARKNAGLSIEELAKKANLAKSTVEKVLFGVVKHPRIDTVQAIERALGLAPTFTEEEIAQGVGNHPNVLSDRDLNTLGIINHAEDILGYEYVDKFLTLLELTANQKEKNQK